MRIKQQTQTQIKKKHTQIKTTPKNFQLPQRERAARS